MSATRRRFLGALGGLALMPAGLRAAVRPSSGFWYTTGMGGRGVGLEMDAAGMRAYLGWYTYDADGRDVWYVGTCAYDGMACGGVLAQYAGGAPFASPGAAAARPSIVGNVATVSLRFATDSLAVASVRLTDGTAATYDLARCPGRRSPRPRTGPRRPAGGTARICRVPVSSWKARGRSPRPARCRPASSWSA